MSFSVSGFGIDDGPEAEEGMEIPGFPKQSRPEGFAGNLQGHLEKLASNAKSIHHVLEALCGGLDRLEKKVDTTSSQMESRLANIVHHITGEADEDTMSAWESLNGGGGGGGGPGSPTDMGPLSLRRRSSFGQQMTSFMENPLVELQNDELTLDAELAEVGRGGVENDEMRPTIDGVVKRAKEMARVKEGGGATWAEAAKAGTTPIDGGVKGATEKAQGWDETPATGDNGEIDAKPSRDDNFAEPSSAAMPSKGESKRIAGASNDAVVQKATTNETAKELSVEPTTPAPTEQRTDTPLVVHGVSGGDDGVNDPPQRRRSNQDDQSDGSNSKLNSARDSSMSGGSFPEEGAGQGQGSIDYPPSFNLQGSIESGESDARYIARQRWIWALGRVCQLVRRRKRKQFEIMSQRATDRTVRMGSRVSVVEKRLDETKEQMLVVDRLRDKSGAHTAQIKSLKETVTELCKLIGVEERSKGLVQAAQNQMEAAFKSDLKALEGKVNRGHRELETSLEGEIRRNGGKLEDMDDRYARSEEALRRAEERIGEVQEEVSAVTCGISEVERQLRVDEERLDNLENLKKAHQRRLSEIRVKLEGTPGGIVPVEPEAEETDDERMARFLTASGASAEFLAADLDKILENCSTGSRTLGGAENGLTVGIDDDGRVDDTNTMEKLRLVSEEAAEFSLFCSKSGGGTIGLDGGASNRRGFTDVGAAVERAESLCSRIEGLLSAHNNSNDTLPPSSLPAANVELQRKDSSSGGGGGNNDEELMRSKNNEYSNIGDITCPNGRKDLPLRLATLRDALLPVIGERTSLGSLKVALLSLAANVKDNLEQKHAADLLESRWHDLHGTVSSLNNSVSDMKNSLRDNNGRLHRNSMDIDDHGGGGGGERGYSEDELEDRLGFKADVSWVQHELQRLWDAVNSRAVASVVVASGMGSGVVRQDDSSRPRSAPSSNNSNSRSNNEKDNPETAGEEESDIDASLPLTPNSRVISATLPSATVLSTGLGGGVGGSAGSVARLQHAEHEQRSSFNEGSSLIKDLLRKTSRLEQQMASKADTDEVTRALSSAGNKLHKLGVIIPAIQEELSNKIERKDLAKLVALISNSTNMSDGAPGAGTTTNNTESSENTAVLASRLNSKFRCLSCDRPLPALGPPGPPKLGASGLSVAGAGAPRSPQRTKAFPGQQRLRLTAGGDESSRPTTPVMMNSDEDAGDVAGWGGSSNMAPGGASENDGVFSYSKDLAGRRRQQQQQQDKLQRGGDQPAGRLEPIGANGEQITGVLSRYPRMMPPPSRIRTAAGGGIGSRPGSSSGGRI